MLYTLCFTGLECGPIPYLVATPAHVRSAIFQKDLPYYPTHCINIGGARRGMVTLRIHGPVGYVRWNDVVFSALEKTTINDACKDDFVRLAKGLGGRYGMVWYMVLPMVWYGMDGLASPTSNMKPRTYVNFQYR